MPQSVQIEEMEASGKCGEPILLPIAAGPATGYSWHLELPSCLQQIVDGPPRTIDASSALGAATGGNLRVAAMQAGDHLITARLTRPWQPDRPARVVRILVRVAP